MLTGEESYAADDTRDLLESRPANFSIHTPSVSHNGQCTRMCSRLSNYFRGLFGGGNRAEIVEDPDIPMEYNLAEGKGEQDPLILGFSNENVDESALEGRNSLRKFVHFFSRRHINESEIYSKKTALVKTLNSVLSLSGALMLSWLSYDFSDKIGVGAGLGVPLGVVSIFPGLLGFLTINYPHIKDIAFWKKEDLEVLKPIAIKEDFKKFLLAIPAVVTTTPLAWSTYKMMSPHMGPYSYYFATTSFLCFYFYYNKTSNDFIKFLGENKRFFKGCAALDTTERRIESHIRRVEKLILRASDKDIDDIYSFVMNGREGELLRLINTDADHYRRVNAEPLNVEDVRVPRLFSIGMPTIGAAVGLAGSYYFFAIGKDSMGSIMEKLDISESSRNYLVPACGSLIYVCKGIFSMVTGATTWLHLSTQTTCRNQGKMELCKKTLIPAVFAIAGTVPSTQLALEYLSSYKGGTLLSVATSVSTFSGSFWGISLFIKKHFGHKRDSKKEDLLQIISKLKPLIPYLRESVKNELYEWIAGFGETEVT